MKKLFFRLPESMSPQARSAFLITTLMAVAHFVALLYYLYLGRTTGIAQFNTLAVIAFALGILFGISAVLSRRGQPTLGIFLMLGVLAVSYPPIGTLVSGLGLTTGVALMFGGPMVAFQILSRRSGWVMTVVTVVSGLATLLLDVFGSAARPSLPGIVIQFLAVSVIAILVYFIVRQFRDYSLRTKIVLGILVIEGISIGVLAYFALTRAGQVITSVSSKFENSVQVQTEAQLTNVVKTEATNADQLFSSTKDSLVKLADYRAQLESQNTILGQGAYWDAHTKLSLLPEGQYGNSATDIASVFLPKTMTVDDKVLAELNTSAFLDFSAPGVLKNQPQIVAVYYISALGSTTYYPNIGLASVVPADFDALSQPFYAIADPQNDPNHIPMWTEPYQDPAGNGLMVTSSAPVYSANGDFKGVIGMDMQLARISENISQIKIGNTGFAFLVDKTGHILAMPPEGYALFGLQPEKVPVNESPKEIILGHGSADLQAVTTRLSSGETGLSTVAINGEETYIAFAPLNTPGYSLGVIVPVSELNTAIVASRQEIRNENTSSLQAAILILIGLLVGAILLSLGMSQVITAPLTRLTQTAEQITSGDLSARAIVETQDETGTLAIAFNRMADRLNEILSGLEQRVKERTHSLELATEVGRSVSQVRALDLMLKDAAELIRSRFDLYYVQVYLTNSSQTALVLQSGTGTVGTELLSRGHQLPLNTASINGRAAIEKRSVVVADTSTSATFRPNPLLPDTHSEMAVPLLIGEKVVGVLDLQSQRANALNQDILSAFEALAGQLAIAIQNSTFLAEMEQARAEVESQARRQTRANWVDYMDAIHKPEETGFVFEQNKIAPMTQVEQSQPSTNENALTAPIAVTGEALGNLVVEMEGQSPISRTSELVNTVARQVAQQIESLRLLDSAERYRFEAEQASRRLTREGWKDYMDANADEGLSFIYDLKEVRPYNQDGDQQTEESATTLPLKVHDEIIGKLVVQGLGSDDKESLELANAVAERLGAHIESLRQFEETKRGQIELDKRAQQLEAVAEINTVSSKELDIDKMLHSVVHLTQRQFGLYHAHVFIYNENTAELKIAACGWKEGDIHEGTDGTAVIPFAQERSLVARAARTRQVVIVNDVHNEPGWLPNPLLPDTASEMAVPLIIGDQILGVLDVQSERLNAFSEEDANIQTTLAAQVSTALQNARSFAHAQQQAERESTLNLISQKIQSATTVEAVLQIAARELGHALGAPMTIAQLSMKDKK